MKYRPKQIIINGISTALHNIKIHDAIDITLLISRLSFLILSITVYHKIPDGQIFLKKDCVRIYPEYKIQNKSLISLEALLPPFRDEGLAGHVLDIYHILSFQKPSKTLRDF